MHPEGGIGRTIKPFIEEGVRSWIRSSSREPWFQNFLSVEEGADGKGRLRVGPNGKFGTYPLNVSVAAMMAAGGYTQIHIPKYPMMEYILNEMIDEIGPSLKHAYEERKGSHTTETNARTTVAETRTAGTPEQKNISPADFLMEIDPMERKWFRYHLLLWERTDGEEGRKEIARLMKHLDSVKEASLLGQAETLAEFKLLMRLTLEPKTLKGSAGNFLEDFASMTGWQEDTEEVKDKKKTEESYYKTELDKFRSRPWWRVMLWPF